MCWLSCRGYFACWPILVSSGLSSQSHLYSLCVLSCSFAETPMTSAHLSPGLFSCLRSSSYQTWLHHPFPWMFSHHYKLQPVAHGPAWPCLLPSLHSDDTFPVMKGQSPLAHLVQTGHPIPYAPQFCFFIFMVTPPILLLYLSPMELLHSSPHTSWHTNARTFSKHFQKPCWKGFRELLLAVE